MDIYNKIIEKEKDRWTKLNYNDWVEFNAKNQYEIINNEKLSEGETRYYIEIDLLEQTNEYVHPSVVFHFDKEVIIDNKKVSVSKPHCSDWIVNKDGRVDI